MIKINMSEEFDWIKDVPDYIGFENLEFEPHEIRKGLENLDLLPGGLRDLHKDMVQAKMYFGPKVWISVVGGGLTYSNIENDIYEVWSSELDDPIAMSREDITKHMKLLQNIND